MLRQVDMNGIDLSVAAECQRVILCLAVPFIEIDCNLLFVLIISLRCYAQEPGSYL